MSLILDLLLLGVPVLLLVLGWSRGIQREALTLCGILLGALLAEWWAPVWAANNTLFNQEPQALQATLSGAMLLFTTIFLGYGGALLLPSRRRLAHGINRIYGALLGGLNGMLIVGLLFRYSIARFGVENSRVALTRFGVQLAEGLPQVLLWGVFAATVMILFRLTMKTLVRLHRGPQAAEETAAEPEKSAPAPAPEPEKPKPPQPHMVQDPILRDLLADEYRNKA